ncbi:(2Fe-2S) ferredoxin domain-containing protein [bacterium]|nr:(2Fe-2S) ferredoxin domain-containing protein [bacterium]
MTIALKTPEITSKKRFQPESGPITGLIAAFHNGKNGLRSLTVETVRGTFEARLDKELREALTAELEVGMAVRCWLRVKGSKVKAQLVLPLEAKQVVYTGARSACIWVCTSKSCCRKGGTELLKSLRKAAQENPDIQVKQSDCLGACKKGPTLKMRGDKKVYQVTPGAAPEWLNAALARN